MPDPIEIPPRVMDMLNKSDTFYDLLRNWERRGPGHSQSLERQAALDMVREILPDIEPLHCLDTLGQLWYDLSEGWILEIYQRPLYYSRLPRYRGVPRGSPSARVIVPRLKGQLPARCYVSRGMVYAYLPGSGPEES
jgi:hypothetical protein